MQRLSRTELFILIGNIWLLTSYTSFMYPIYWWTALPPGCLFLLSQVESWGMSLFICVLIRSSYEAILQNTGQCCLQPDSPQLSWGVQTSFQLLGWYPGEVGKVQAWNCSFVYSWFCPPQQFPLGRAAIGSPSAHTMDRTCYIRAV